MTLLALSDRAWEAIVGGLATATPILFGLWLTHRKVKEVAVNTNSMREQMVASAKTEGHAAGVADQKADAGNGLVKDVLVAVAEIKGHAAGVAEQKAADAKEKP